MGYLSHDTPLLQSQCSHFLATKGFICRNGLFGGGGNGCYVYLQPSLSHSAVCTCSFSQEPVCPNSLMHTSKQSLKLLRLCLHGYFNTTQLRAATGWGGLALAFTPLHVSVLLLPVQSLHVPTSSNQAAIQIGEPIHPQTDLFLSR